MCSLMLCKKQTSLPRLPPLASPSSQTPQSPLPLTSLATCPWTCAPPAASKSASMSFVTPYVELELREELPMVTVVAGEYPIATPFRLLGEFLSSFRIVFFVFMLFGDWIREKTGIEIPRYDWIKNNKLQAGLMVFAVCSLGSSYLLSSGAFEASYNGSLIFSKLKMGRMPHPGEIAALIRAI